MNAMLRRGTNNNGRNYVGTKDDERGSIEADEPEGSISAKTKCNEHFNPEVADAGYDWMRRKTFKSVQTERVRKK